MSILDGLIAAQQVKLDAQVAFRAPLGGKAKAQQNSNVSNGTDTYGHYRTKHIVTQDTNDLSVAWSNWNQSGGAEADGANPITIRAAIEDAAGTKKPVYFDGQRDVVILPGGTAECDPVGVSALRGDAVYLRTRVVVNSGQTWPLGRTLNTADGEGIVSNTTVQDLTTSGTITTVGSNTIGYGPSMLRGILAPGSTCIAIVGDSIADGTGDSSADTGFVYDALNNRQPHQQVTYPGSRADQFKGASNARRMPLLAACSHAIVNFGANDVGASHSAATMEADLMVVWRQLAALGLSVWQTTITPRSTSSDSWATTGNQTTHANNAARVAVNTWLRGGSPIDATTLAPVAVGTGGALIAGAAGHPLKGYIEAANTVESAQDSGLWKVTGAANYATSDGLHPSAAAHALMAAAVSAALTTILAS